MPDGSGPMKRSAIAAAIILWLAAATLGGFVLFLYGGHDDSPGAQLIAIILVAGAVALGGSTLKRIYRQ